MAKTKTLLILANSVKHAPGVCIAGREIRDGVKGYTIHPWIRPISSHGEGELWPREYQLNTGKQPHVMGFVEVTLEKPAKEPFQPENWLIDATTRWKSVNQQFQKPDYAMLLETPNDLWQQKGERTDRVSPEFLRRNPPDQSLYFVQVQNLRARFEWAVWEGQYKKKRRAFFYYKGVEYDFNITDPLFMETYASRFPAQGERPITFAVPSTGDPYLCVSLAPEWKGYHYKVVATVFTQ